MSPLWRKQLEKAADLIVELPAGHSAWPEEMFEPLTITFLFLFSRYRPWQIARAPALVGAGKQLRKVWKENQSAEGPILRKLWSKARSMDSLSQDVVFKLLRSSEGFTLPHSSS